MIYIATIANTHAELARRCIAAGKPLLIEKPMALCAEDVSDLIAKARERRVLLVEGMWTRAFPAVRKLRELLGDGAIGDVIAVQTDFGWPASSDPDGEHARLLDATSGGCALDIAMYPIAHVLCASGGAAPSVIRATGQRMPTPAGASVDWCFSASLSGFEGRPALCASILCSLHASTPEEVVITGTKGTLRLHGPAHAPERLTLSVAHGRSFEEETFEFPLPPTPEGALPFVRSFKRRTRCPMQLSTPARPSIPDGRHTVPCALWLCATQNYPGAEGFVYEARAVHEALQVQQCEADHWTHHEAQVTMQVIDALRAAVE